MTLIERLKQDALTARKAQDKLAGPLLSTLLAEATRVSEADYKNGNTEINDEKVIRTIRSFVSGIDQTLATSLPEGDTRDKLTKEKEVLSAYLPSQMSVDELKAQIIAIADEMSLDRPLTGKSIGIVMSNLKDRCGGRFDGKDAANLIKML